MIERKNRRRNLGEEKETLIKRGREKEPKKIEYDTIMEAEERAQKKRKKEKKRFVMQRKT